MFKKCYKHLDTVHEKYFEHLFFAFSFGLRMIGAGCAAILHGLFPAIFQRTGSQTIYKLHAELQARLKQDDHHHG